MASNGGGACSGCEHVSPCLDQGLCLDPTVLNLPGDSVFNAPHGDDDLGGGGGAGGAGPSSTVNQDNATPRPVEVTGVTGGGTRQAFLIEGQLVVASPDGGWMPLALSTMGDGGGSGGANGGSAGGSGQQAAARGTPLSVGRHPGFSQLTL